MVELEKQDTTSGVIWGCGSNIRQLDRRDVESVRQGLSEKYGIEAPEEMAADLIAFIEEVLDEP